jgi:hypothetical protein
MLEKQPVSIDSKVARFGACGLATLLLPFDYSRSVSERARAIDNAKTKLCWICAKDVDELGLSVHQSCDEKRMLLKAATLKMELWRRAQSGRQAA